MNVDDAMETAAAYLAAEEQYQEPLFTAEVVAVVLAAEVERLRAELAAAKSGKLLEKWISDRMNERNQK